MKNMQEAFMKMNEIYNGNLSAVCCRLPDRRIIVVQTGNA